LVQNHGESPWEDKKMRTDQTGFTLIELVVVIVILGILAATAIPKFIDMRSDASLAAAQGVAGAVSSGFATNFAAYVANSTNANAHRVSGTVTVTAAAGSVIGGAGMPAGYTATAGAATVDCGTTVGSGVSITISTTTNGSTQTAAAALICTG